MIVPGWPAPPWVHAVTSTRGGGVSPAPYVSLNLATHVGDAERNVAENRRRLLTAAALPRAPRWPAQVHGTRTVDAAELDEAGSVEADAVYTDRPGIVCAILTADCLPIVACSRDRPEVAVIHAGWRGLLDGVVESAIARFRTPPDRILAWIGPGISARAYAVDDTFRARFVAADPGFAAAFSAHGGSLFADLPLIATRRLTASGVGRTWRSEACTHGEPARFFSYRRDGLTGRIATCAWLDGSPAA